MIDIRDLIDEYEVPNFSYLKKEIIESITENRSLTVSSEIDGYRITDTNFYTPGKPYRQVVYDVLDNFFGSIQQYEGLKVEYRNQIWHQIYERGDSHTWHNHPHTNMASVLFVECPSPECGTLFDINGKECVWPAREGTIITFPASLVHMSPEHKFDERKTIISFNWDLHANSKVLNGSNNQS